MKVVYVAGRYSGKDAWEIEKNIREAEFASMIIAKYGGAFICVHTMSRFFNGILPEKFFIEADNELLRRCDAVFLVSNWKESRGAIAEKFLAEELGIPVFDDFRAIGAWIMDVKVTDSLPSETVVVSETKPSVAPDQTTVST